MPLGREDPRPRQPPPRLPGTLQSFRGKNHTGKTINRDPTRLDLLSPSQGQERNQTGLGKGEGRGKNQDFPRNKLAALLPACTDRPTHGQTHRHGGLGHAPALGSNAQLAPCKRRNKIAVSRAQQDLESGAGPRGKATCPRSHQRERDAPPTPASTHGTASLATLPALG